MFELKVIIIAILIIANTTAKDLTEGLGSALKKFSKKVQNISQVNTEELYAPINIKPDQLIKHYKYKAEKHVITTEDGYNLTLYRITGNKTHPSPVGKQAVLFQHGVLGSSMDWLITGPNRSFAFTLADLGYDVWLANTRGCIYSRAHKTFKLNQKEFWDFSWHEMGYYDLPAEIDYILTKTGNKKIFYVGHSQGSTIYYVLLSERPEYNDKILASYSLAPVAFYSHPKPLYELLAKCTDLLYEASLEVGLYELDVFNEKTQQLASNFCNKTSNTAELCRQLAFLINGYSEDQFDQDMYSIYLKYYPAGASIKQIAHFGQLINSGHFRKFDYGKKLNKKKYNNIAPPDYKLENIIAPTTLFYSVNDALTSVEDVTKLYNRITNKKGLFRVSHSSFNHVDFLLGKDVKKLVYNNIIQLMKAYLA